ncbi:MAG: signal peptidase II [Desulfobacteraceae bacterium]|nr:signal peptidase II [Desulfobacteraceae bacterium]
MGKSKTASTLPFFLFSGGLILLDQLTKYLLVQAIPLNTGIPVIPGFFNLIHVHNTGGAFSIFAASGAPWRQWVFIGLTVIVVAVIVYVYGKVPKGDWWTRMAYVCITGGAVGNLIDRVRLGEVVDFLDVYVGSWHWPAFNVADSAISVGAVMLLVSLLRNK